MNREQTSRFLRQQFLLMQKSSQIHQDGPISSTEKQLKTGTTPRTRSPISRSQSQAACTPKEIVSTLTANVSHSFWRRVMMTMCIRARGWSKVTFLSSTCKVTYKQRTEHGMVELWRVTWHKTLEIMALRWSSGEDWTLKMTLLCYKRRFSRALGRENREGILLHFQ